MGTWALEQNLGVGITAKRFIWFENRLFLATSPNGIWERTAGPLWVQRYNPVTLYGDQFVAWNGYLWCFTDDDVMRSDDGINWVVDVDLRALNGDVNYTIETINYNATHLYVSGIRRAPGDTFTYYYERDADGNWSASTCTTPAGGTLLDDFVYFGNYYYHTLSGSFVQYWTGTAWANVAGLPAHPAWFTVSGGILWAKFSDAAPQTSWIYWVDPATDAWTQISTSATHTSHYGRISVGADGSLYYAISDWAVSTEIHQRLGGPPAPADGWFQFDTTAVDSEGNVAWADGASGLYLFARSNAASVRVYVYTPTWDVHPIAPGGAIGYGLCPTGMDVDGDSDRLYIAVYNNVGNFPELVSVNLPLAALALGWLSFQPGAGDAVNVRCNDVGDRVVVSGYFGANEQVEASDTGGVAWTDVDPGTWAANRAQPLIVGATTEDEIMVALHTLQDLYETLDGGTTWTPLNTAIGYNPGAMAKIPNGDELIMGDGAANRIDYSPNRGAQLTNITGAFVGNVAALEITL
jgi:hypothetical protein